MNREGFGQYSRPACRSWLLLLVEPHVHMNSDIVPHSWNGSCFLGILLYLYNNSWWILFATAFILTIAEVSTLAQLVIIIPPLMQTRWEQKLKTCRKTWFHCLCKALDLVAVHKPRHVFDSSSHYNLLQIYESNCCSTLLNLWTIIYCSPRGCLSGHMFFRNPLCLWTYWHCPSSHRM